MIDNKIVMYIRRNIRIFLIKIGLQYRLDLCFGYLYKWVIFVGVDVEFYYYDVGWDYQYVVGRQVNCVCCFNFDYF